MKLYVPAITTGMRQGEMLGLERRAARDSHFQPLGDKNGFGREDGSAKPFRI
jgi:hypothetical protein